MTKLLVYTAALAGLGTALQAAEARSARHSTYEAGGLLAWDILRTDTLLPRAARRIYDPHWADLRAIGGLRAATGLLLVIFAIANEFAHLPPMLCGWLAASLVLIQVLVSLRSRWGLDGAFQMSLVTLSGAAYGLIGSSSSAETIGAAFVSAQLTLSYIVAGVAKLRSQVWRQGRAAAQVLATSAYGGWKGPVLKLASRGSWLICWATILFEVLFIGAWLDHRALLGGLAVGVTFHLGIAILMGLNTFLVHFAAAYPMAIYCSIRIHQIV